MWSPSGVRCSSRGRNRCAPTQLGARGEANLIRRREETAAVRSQANTAKLLADNPALTRLRELEALQEILRGAKTTFVFGSGQQNLGDQVTSMLRRDAEQATQ